MHPQISVQKVLRNKLAEIQSFNPRYSLRAFARKVGVDAGALSSIINGKRMISKKMAYRIASRLMLDPQEHSELISCFQEPYKKLTKNEITYLQLTQNQFKLMAEWQHLAILSLLNTSDFDSSPEWIAERLGISKSCAIDSIERLIGLGLLEKQKTRLVRSKSNLRTSDDVADISIRKFHDSNLDLAKASLHRDHVSVRDFSAITFAICTEKLTEAKAIIRKCQDELADLLETSERNEVYRFSAQLFPITVLKKKNKEIEGV